ncbi:MAG: alpha/beta hydrolase [Rhodocyclaceae bacterium]|jgi:pimeloyl-ACP methyl ester carboxylesterase|nr:alpha/beta hydrolase [Rhodocyclaceae bacterium]
MPLSQQSFLSLGADGFHRIAYTDWGDARNPHVVVCVHGLSRNSRDFDRLAAALETDHRVVCMDVVGRGDSDWLDDKSGYSFGTYLGDAAALIARVTTPAAGGLLESLQARLRGGRPVAKLDWIGTSMGGLIGMLLAAKPGSPIRRLVLNDVGPFVPWNALIRLKGHVGSETRFADFAAVERYVRKACSSCGQLDEAFWQHLARHAAVQEPDGGYRLRYDPALSRGLPVHLDPELPIGPEFLRGIDLWSVWAAVRCPVLVLRGADSEVLPAETMEEMQRRKPNMKIVEFPGVGHAPALASADQIEAVRDFLGTADEDDEQPQEEMTHDSR